MFLNKKYVIPAILAMSQTQAVAQIASERVVSNKNAVGMISQFLTSPMSGQRGMGSCQVEIVSQSEEGFVVNIFIKKTYGTFEVQVPFNLSDKRYSKLSSTGLLSVSFPKSENFMINGNTRLSDISFFVNSDGERSVSIYWGKDSVEFCRAK